METGGIVVTPRPTAVTKDGAIFYLLCFDIGGGRH
jgi:hypothetical protein